MTSNDSTLLGTEGSTPATEANPEAAAPGARIGRYIIVDKLGQGGMGVVYAAYDPELDRKVAVKVLHARSGGTAPRVDKARGKVMQALFGDDELGSAQTAAALDLDQQRLLREAQGAARINHPNVVSVYDVGHQLGRVFVAMEFVPGKTLRAWLAEGPHPWRAVCGVMAQAGAGLAAAHDRGLIHRDFKPDNVMIDDEGRVRVMDFGLVRPDREVEPDTERVSSSEAMQPTTNALALELTRKGAVAGTPAYMSPEQIAGDELDARSDQFSFCVTLWEGLFGQRPFSGDSLVALAAAVLAGEVQDTSSARDIPAAIRAAAQRGLSVESAARWPSMHELVAALQRDPLRTRNRAFAIGGGVLAIAVGVGGWQAHRRTQLAQCERDGQAAGLIWNEDAAIRIRERLMATGVAYAQATADTIGPRLDAYTAQWAELAENVCRERVLGTATVETEQALQCLAERRTDLEGTVGALDEIDKTTISGATLVVGSLEPIEHCTDEAALARRSLRGDVTKRRAESSQHERVREAQRLDTLGKYAQARSLVEGVIAETEDQPDSGVRAWALYRLGMLDVEEGKFEDAQRHLVDSVFLGTANGDEPTVANATAELAWLIGYRQGRPKEAEVWMRWSETLIGRLGLSDELVGAALDDRLSMLESSRGNFDEARRRLERALRIKQRVLGPEHPELAISLNLLGNVQIKSTGLSEAAESWNQSLAILERAYGSSHPDLATPLSNLAQIRFREGNFAAARELLERSIDLQGSRLGPDHPEIGRALGNLALVMREAGDPVAAQVVLERSTKILEGAHGRQHPVVAVSLANQGRNELELDHPDRALELLGEALEIQQAVLPEEHIDLAITISTLGEAMLAKGNLTEALEKYEHALAICESIGDPVHTPAARLAVAKARWRLGQGQAAIPLLESAIDELEASGQAKVAAVGRSLLGRVMAEDATTEAQGIKLVEDARAELVEFGDKAIIEEIDAWQAERAEAAGD